MQKQSFGIWLKQRGFKLENMLPGLGRWELVPPIPEHTITLTDFMDALSPYTPAGTSHEMLYPVLQPLFDEWLRDYLAKEAWVVPSEQEEDALCF